MKKTLAVLILAVTIGAGSYAQNVNWRSLSDDQPNIVQLNLGYDYGVTTQLGYSRYLTIIRPVLFGVDYSFPMGNDLLDDFKVRLGAQVEVVDIDGFSATLKIQANFRRYQNAMVRILNFASDFGLVAGYYSSTWYAAGEGGFDKAVTSHLKHSDIMRNYVYAGVKDGWYVPTGGHFYYGLQGGGTIAGSFDISLRLGATTAQFSDEDAAVPYYVQLGLGTRF